MVALTYHRFVRVRSSHDACWDDMDIAGGMEDVPKT